MKLFIPHNLDLTSLIYDKPPTFRNFKRDKLRYIIHLIYGIPQFKKDLLLEDFIPINAQKLQAKIGKNYKDYLNYLIDDLKIVECNNHYKKGEYSKGYRLTVPFRKSKVVGHNVVDWKFRRLLKQHKAKHNPLVGNHKYLTKWFYSGKLKIDMPLVKNALETELQFKLLNKQLCNVDRKTKKTKDPWNQYNHAMISAENLDSGEFHLQIDQNVYRLHSNLTNMRSLLRNALTYDGQKLISLDIKNSQPYLSTVLFNKEFWGGKYFKDKPSLKQSFKRAQNSPTIGLFNISKDIITINQIKVSETDSYIMLGENGLNLVNKDFKSYTDLVVSGQLYPYLRDQFKRRLNIEYSSYKEVKAAVFQVMFTDNRFFGQIEAAPKRFFKECFPDVYDVFAQIKRKDSTFLPRLLQSIESYLIIDVIAKRFSIEYPKAPIFKIHDSIATTEEYIDKLHIIMHQELTKAIGNPPKLDPEEWCPDNIIKHLDGLKRITKVVA